MYDEEIKEKLRRWANEYNVSGFIKDDPVQFPHRYTEKRDIEVSAFIYLLDFLRTQGTDPPESERTA